MTLSTPDIKLPTELTLTCDGCGLAITAPAVWVQRKEPVRAGMFVLAAWLDTDHDCDLPDEPTTTAQHDDEAHRPNACCDFHRHIADGCCHCGDDGGTPAP